MKATAGPPGAHLALLRPQHRRPRFGATPRKGVAGIPNGLLRTAQLYGGPGRRC